MDLSSYFVAPRIPEYLPKMQGLYKDLFSGGKGYRGRLVQYISDELGVPQNQGGVLARSIEFIHNSSLLHDDIVDEAPLRRGKEAAWKKYGSGYTVLAGDYLLARVINDLCELKSLELVQFTSQTILSLVEGEWLQDACHGRVNVTLEEMQKVHELKTSSLFSWCFAAPCFLSDKVSLKEQEVFKKIGADLGALLQRSDDLLDFDIRNSEGKTTFQDAPSGYFNLFMIFLLKTSSETEKKKVWECKTLEDFKKLGFDIRSALECFDQESQSILERVQGNLESLSGVSLEFKEEILNMAVQVYFRS